jgi:CDP-diacylglycerol--glycerol-3-phosphate 3-phosphatidyltransferase
MAVLLGSGRNDVAFAVFLFAIVTDLLDGWAARRLQAFNPWAKFVDPLADKLLTDFTWVALALLGWAPAAFPVVMIGRDLAVGVGFWRHVRSRGALPEARPLGQISVAFEGTALCVLLFHGPWLGVHWPTVGTVLGAIALALSGLDLLEYARGRSTT